MLELNIYAKYDHQVLQCFKRATYLVQWVMSTLDSIVNGPNKEFRLLNIGSQYWQIQLDIGT